MALQHIIQHQTGAASHYWRISEMYLYSLTKTGTVKIVGYVSEQARQQNMVPLDERTFQINSTEYDTWFASTSVDTSTSSTKTIRRTRTISHHSPSHLLPTGSLFGDRFLLGEATFQIFN